MAGVTPWLMPSERAYAHSERRWGTLAVGHLKLQHGRDWSAEDYMDIAPEFPDRTNYETRRASTYTPFKGDPVKLSDMRVVEICAQYALLKARVPSAFNDAWIAAFEEELDYRANRHAYETQTQGRTDPLG